MQKRKPFYKRQWFLAILSFAILQCIFILLELTGWVPRLKEIDGCQNANIKGIWFNPHMTKNTTTIKPYAEIHSFDSLLSYFHNSIKRN